MFSLPPLSLYIHLPWCVRKCPYCDFNSHAVKQKIPEAEYIDILLADLDTLLPQVWNRPVHAIFFGGGTPSLFSGASLQRLLDGVRARLPLTPNIEITLEANPGSVEYDHFSAYFDAGINRISLGVQSFNDAHLKKLGRIHTAREADKAITKIRRAGFKNLNLDLMFALPEQSHAEALTDIDKAVTYQPEHISHYQLTLEPNTAFAANPPRLPDHDSGVDMQLACADLLQTANYHQYEISAWGQPEKACQHNLNYWRFGDYLGIGAGAHGKITLPAEEKIQRYARQRHPKIYLQAASNNNWNSEIRDLNSTDLIFEYFLNHFRLREKICLSHFEKRTNLMRDKLDTIIEKAIQKGLLERHRESIQTTKFGWRFINDLQALFLIDH